MHSRERTALEKRVPGWEREKNKKKFSTLRKGRVFYETAASNYDSYLAGLLCEITGRRRRMGEETSGEPGENGASGNTSPPSEKYNENGPRAKRELCFFPSFYRFNVGTRMKVRAVCPEESPLYTCESFSR